tara:strand:+ start:512 stop:1375 length:864 start_codon:yes stop_codon:yes gene_type:complete
VINYFLKQKIKKINSLTPSYEDIQKSNKILFSIFTRYGDTIIALQVIKELIEQYPTKEYLIFCPKQMQPYAKELLPHVECLALNKRNILDLIKSVRIIKKREFDIGFNPWSNGLDSCFLISYCNKFLFYKDFDRPKVINHYQVVRRYLKLDEKDWVVSELELKESYNKILICPQSTDIDRAISGDALDKLIIDLQEMYNHPRITIASIDKSFFRDDCFKFKFEKTKQSSEKFIDLIKKNALVVCSDSGPLHIALALKKDILAIMRTTLPDIVINTESRLNIKNINNR